MAGAGIRIKQRILRSHDRFWSPSDFDAPRSTTQHVLAELEREKELRHLRRGLYWRGTKTPLGMSPPPPSLLAEQLAPIKGSGPAGLSAANALRLSTQIPRRSQIAIPGRCPSHGNIEFVCRRGRTARRSANLNTTEVAYLEMLDDPSASELSAPETWRRLGNLLDSGSIRAEYLARASKTEPARVRARLASLLRESGRDDIARRIPAVDKRVVQKALAGYAKAS